jgi:putative Holliday junction resolvase
MRYLGIDYGTKKIGVAISDDSGGFAFPRDVIENDEKKLDAFVQFIEKERIDEIVLGDTLSYNGEPNHITKEADKFAFDLLALVKIPLHRVREAWSSQEAARYAPQGKKHNDSSAAAIILQRFLDKREGLQK